MSNAAMTLNTTDPVMRAIIFTAKDSAAVAPLNISGPFLPAAKDLNRFIITIHPYNPGGFSLQKAGARLQAHPE